MCTKPMFGIALHGVACRALGRAPELEAGRWRGIRIADLLPPPTTCVVVVVMVTDPNSQLGLALHFSKIVGGEKKRAKRKIPAGNLSVGVVEGLHGEGATRRGWFRSEERARQGQCCPPAHCGASASEGIRGAGVERSPLQRGRPCRLDRCVRVCVCFISECNECRAREMLEGQVWSDLV